jgi:ribosome-associated protein
MSDDLKILAEDLKILNEIKQTLSDKFADDIKILDIREKATFADYMVLATANNPTQVRSISEWTEKKLKSLGAELKHSEGYATSRWILLDFTTIIVHVFHKEDRKYYGLDELWKDAKELEF